MSDIDRTSPLKPRRSRGRALVRIEDVARAAQVSPQTVSRFFRTPALVSTETRAAISAAVEATGYVPNLVAGSLASNRSRIIAIVVPTIANPTHSAPVEGLSSVVRAAGYQVLLGTTAYDRATEGEVVRALLGRQIDGLVITGGEVEPDTRRAIERAGIPVVQIWELPAHPIDMAVGFSNLDAGGAVAQHLAERGYRRPLVLAHAASADTRSAARVAGFLAGAVDLGLGRPTVVSLASTSPVDGRDVLRTALATDAAFDSVFAVSDQLAVSIILAAAAQGLELPRAFGVVGFGDLDLADQVTPTLTTVRVPRRRLGELAGQMLLQRLDGGASIDSVVDIGFELVIRASTPPIAAARDKRPSRAPR